MLHYSSKLLTDNISYQNLAQKSHTNVRSMHKYSSNQQNTPFYALLIFQQGYILLYTSLYNPSVTFRKIFNLLFRLLNTKENNHITSLQKMQRMDTWRKGQQLIHFTASFTIFGYAWVESEWHVNKAASLVHEVVD